MGNRKRIAFRLKIENYQFLEQLASRNGWDMVDELNRILDDRRLLDARQASRLETSKRVN